MSYSYIKSVFPEFDTNSNVYDSKLYNSLTLSNNHMPIGKDEADKKHFDIKKSVTFGDTTVEIPQNTLLEQFDTLKNNSNENSKNNLKYYNIPIEQNTFNNYKNNFNEKKYLEKGERYDMQSIEKFENNLNKEHNSQDYLNHVLNCQECKNILMKQFNMESDKIRNEEMMELISYMIFAILMVVILDSFTQK